MTGHLLDLEEGDFVLALHVVMHHQVVVIETHVDEATHPLPLQGRAQVHRLQVLSVLQNNRKENFQHFTSTHIPTRVLELWYGHMWRTCGACWTVLARPRYFLMSTLFTICLGLFQK